MVIIIIFLGRLLNQSANLYKFRNVCLTYICPAREGGGLQACITCSTHTKLMSHCEYRLNSVESHNNKY
jgi:hypothetical protein